MIRLWWRAYYAFWNAVSSILSQGEEPPVEPYPPEEPYGCPDTCGGCRCLRDGLLKCPDPWCPCVPPRAIVGDSIVGDSIVGDSIVGDSDA
jgi:hypothetical protein